MRKRIIIVGAFVCVICLFLLWWHWRSLPKNRSRIDAGAEVSTNVTPIAKESKKPPLPPSQSAVSTKDQGASQDPRTMNSNAFYQWWVKEGRVPIEFYGKVIDERSNVIAGASVNFSWEEKSMGLGHKTFTTQSDADGLFSLRDARGSILEVGVSKDGYYTPGPGFVGFSYAAWPRFSPDPMNPVVFKLKKKGTPEPLIAIKRNYHIPRDGTPVSIDLLTGANTTGENGNLVVRCWTNDQGKRSGEKYDWHCTVATSGGGIIPTEEEFPFLAPETGYKPSIEINMSADQTNWASDVDLKFYYRLADGRYGRMTFSMIAGGQHFCMVNSLLNPSGSRDLESAN